MEIREIENRKVKIGKTSITVKDDDGKTRGIVKNICKFSDIQPNRQIEAFRMLGKAGIWGSGIDGILDCVIYDGSKFYYLNNTRPLEAYKKYFVGWEHETERYKKRLRIAEDAAKYMTVINCEVL